MGVYYYVCCKSCEISLNLGKKIAVGDGLVLQGIFSEANLSWITDERAWKAIQRFFQDHEGHDLIFTSDENFPPMQLYESADGDELLSR